MRIDRRGGIGFMEAAVAVMAVTVVLALYLGAFALDVHRDNSRDIAFDEGIAASVAVVDGELVADVDDELLAFMERNGCRGITLRCWIPGGIATDTVLSRSIGQTDGDASGCRFIGNVGSDDGRILTAVFEMGAFR
ncbi:MAG: hypothetical protein GXX87_02595 [Euryarchaeota archaeon]|jgi:hypothetical protein|nr:hypothetical protein [Euryarchaeota archaeon]